MQRDSIKKYFVGLLSKNRLYKRLITAPARAKSLSSAEYFDSITNNSNPHKWLITLTANADLSGVDADIHRRYIDTVHEVGIKFERKLNDAQIQ